jgi:hypothetical protein
MTAKEVARKLAVESWLWKEEDFAIPELVLALEDFAKEATQIERERCRLIAFDRHTDVSSDFDEGYDSAVADIVEAIEREPT